jgi:hypothetical protein
MPSGKRRPNPPLEPMPPSAAQLSGKPLGSRLRASFAVTRYERTFPEAVFRPIRPDSPDVSGLRPLFLAAYEYVSDRRQKWLPDPDRFLRVPPVLTRPAVGASAHLPKWWRPWPCHGGAGRAWPDAPAHDPSGYRTIAKPRSRDPGNGYIARRSTKGRYTRQPAPTTNVALRESSPQGPQAQSVTRYAPSSA